MIAFKYIIYTNIKVDKQIISVYTRGRQVISIGIRMIKIINK